MISFSFFALTPSLLRYTLSFSPSVSNSFQLFYFYLDACSCLLVTSSTFLKSALCPSTYSPSILPSVSPHPHPSLHLCALNLVLRDCLGFPAGLAPV